jgi:hypothetical protein
MQLAWRHIYVGEHRASTFPIYAKQSQKQAFQILVPAFLAFLSRKAGTIYGLRIERTRRVQYQNPKRNQRRATSN